MDGPGVSRRHCEVLLRDDGAVVRDLGSSQGTWLDGRLVVGETRLARGALVSLGARGPRFELVAATLEGRSIAGEPPPLGDVTSPSPVPAPAAPAAARDRSRFLAGLAWGAAAGLLFGLLALAFVVAAMRTL
jgi:predicted component of type VI protein secretion system